MIDSNDQQSPPAPVPATPAPQPTPTVVATVEAKVEKTFSTVVKELWAKYGILFVLIGIGLLAVKFGDITMDVLGWSSKKDLQEAQKTDSALKAQEDAANQQADALVKQANDLPKQEGTVPDGWYKNNK